jgi:ABC-2 type transport system ATP-binding protein
MVAVRGVTVRYGKMCAVADVSLEVSRGCVYALLGRNGAGKSSLVRCLLGQQKPSSGAAFLLGLDVWRERVAAMAGVGVVPEEPDAPPAMTPAEVVAFCARLYPTWDQAHVDARLHRFGVPMRTPVGRLSKGQKAQLALAVALGSRPQLLVLDDPTLGLDVVARKELYEELIGELADHGTTVLLTTHDLAGVEGIAQRVGILKYGRLVLDEELETLKARFRRIRFGRAPAATSGAAEVELARLGALAVAGREWGWDTVVGNFHDESFGRFREAEGVAGAEAAPMTLEEIFIAIVGEQEGAAQ